MAGTITGKVSDGEEEKQHPSTSRLFAHPPPPANEVVEFYSTNEQLIDSSIGHTFPGPHSTEKVWNRHILPRLLETLSTNGRDSCRLYDLGSGAGGPGVHMAKTLAAQMETTIIGCTLTEPVSARELAERERVSQSIRFMKGDYHSLSFEAESADAVMIINSLCHSTTPEKVLAEANRVLAPGGILAIKDFYSATAEEMLQYGVGAAEIPELMQSYGRNFRMGYFDKDRLQRELVHQFGEATFVHLGDDTDDSWGFAGAVFANGNAHGGEWSQFGKLVFDGFPAHVDTLYRLPVHEGLWFAKKVASTRE